MHEIAKLFGNYERLKLIQLFIAHPQKSFSTADLRDVIETDGRTIRSYTSSLEQAGLIRKSEKNAVRTKGKSEVRWRLDARATYLRALSEFLSPRVLLSDESLVSEIKARGSLKFLLVSGLFEEMSSEERIVDILIVGDRFDREELNFLIEDLETMIGEEIKYALFTSEEYAYRKSMRDKLLREVLLVPHRILVNRLSA